jgi:hypothetical protein
MKHFKSTILLIFLLACIFSVNAQSKKFKAKCGLNDNDSVHYAFEKISVREVGRLLLLDSLDNKAGFEKLCAKMRCISELVTSKDKETRLYFLHIFNKKIIGCEGFVGEVSGGIAKRHIEKHTLDFAEYMGNFTKDELQVWSYEVAEYVSMDINDRKIKDANVWRKKILAKCPSNHSAYNLLDLFTQEVTKQCKERVAE